MSSGYNKYACRYRITGPCPNWVTQNGAPCGECIVSYDLIKFGRCSNKTRRQAKGRDSSRVPTNRQSLAVPVFNEGRVIYQAMSSIESGHGLREAFSGAEGVGKGDHIRTFVRSQHCTEDTTSL